jgi:N,N'-diacetyllegionaminate synthase
MGIIKKVKEKGIQAFADVFSIERAKFALKSGVDGFKIHSSDIGNNRLLEYVASLDKPILLSCSGCTMNEIDNAIITIKKNNKNSQIVLIHGFQGYPTKLSDINLNRISSLKERYDDTLVGYSDHVDGDSPIAIQLPLVALGLGANIIEKHITIDRSLKEPDYQSSLNPHEFSEMVRLLREAFPALGNSSFEMPEDELTYRKTVKKRPVARHGITEGSVIQEEDVALKRTPDFASEIPLERALGGISKKSIAEDEPLTSENIEPRRTKIIAAIACRIGSTRLFAKPLQLIDKQNSILELQLMQLAQPKLIDEIVLAISDDPENEVFVQFAKQHDLKYIRGDEVNVLHRLILAAEHVGAETVVRVTSECPFVYWQIIDDAIKQHHDQKSDLTYPSNLPLGTHFEIISVEALRKANALGEKKHKSELVVSYIKEHPREFKIQVLGVKEKLRRPEIRLTVDYPEDLILVRRILSVLKDDGLPHMERIIDAIDQDPEIGDLHHKAVSIAQRNDSR